MFSVFVSISIQTFFFLIWGALRCIPTYWSVCMCLKVRSNNTIKEHKANSWSYLLLWPFCLQLLCQDFTAYYKSVYSNGNDSKHKFLSKEQPRVLIYRWFCESMWCELPNHPNLIRFVVKLRTLNHKTHFCIIICKDQLSKSRFL